MNLDLKNVAKVSSQVNGLVRLLYEYAAMPEGDVLP